MVWAAMIFGVALMVVGILIKPKDLPIEFGHMWGFATNSSIPGKIVYIAGAVFLFGGIYTLVGV